MPLDHEASVAGHFAEHAGLDVPLADDFEECVELLGRDDRHHALLALAHEDLLGRERGVAQQHLLEVDAHAAAAVRGELGGRARDAGGAEVLDRLDEVALVELEAALDEHLLGERVADLHRRALRGAAVGERVGREDAGTADAVAAGARPEEHDLVAGAARVRELEVFVAQDADREGVHERVALVDRVEHGLAADVRQAQAVAVERDAAHDAVHDACGVGVVDRAEAQLVHHGDRAGAHRDDVAHDSADAGRGALERLDVARVVVRLDLEGDRPALADVDDAGVLAHAHHEAGLHLVGDLLAELAQVDLAGLVRAVLRPHDGVHRELAARGAAAEDLADLVVLVGLESERGVGLLALGGRGGVVDGIGHGAAGDDLRRGGHAAQLQESGTPDRVHPTCGVFAPWARGVPAPPVAASRRRRWVRVRHPVDRGSFLRARRRATQRSQGTAALGAERSRAEG